MSNQPSLDQLNALTRQGITFLSTLDTLLDEEYTALQKRRIDQLQALVEKKTEALKQLEENNQLRNNLFISAGVTPDKAGIQSYQAQLSDNDSEKFTAVWQDLEKILLQVNEKNARNELAINRNSQNLEKLLSIIRGQNQKNMIYNQSGSKGNYSAQSRIGKA